MSHEIIKLFRDPTWRLQNLYKIIDKQSKHHVLKPNAAQLQLLQSHAHRKAILKARQFGFTTLGVIQKLDTAIWNKNKTCVILAHKREVLDKIFGIVRVAYEGLPSNLRPAIDRGGGSKYELRFPEINSVIYTTLEVRGGTVHDLHISEAAFIPKDRIHATVQAVPIDTGTVTYETTPNGLNHFHDLWNDPENEIDKLFFPWFFHHEYQLPTAPLQLTDDEQKLVEYAAHKYAMVITHEQIAFRRFKIREAGGRLEKFIAEYPEDDQSCFLSSGSNPFDLADIKSKLMQLPDSSTYKRVGEIKIAKPFEKGKNYIVSADVAEGVRSDYSSADIICVDDMEQVAQYRSNAVSPGDFGEILYQMGQLYCHGGVKWPTMIVERNNHGHAVLLKLEELRYPNMWKDTDDRPGHRTTAITRPILLDQFIEAVRDGVFKIRFRETYQECLTLVDNNGKIEADSGKHDDAVISAALGLKASLKAVARIDLYKNIHTKIRS